MKNKLTLRKSIFLVGIALLIIPQTRQPLQVLVHKGLALVNPVKKVSEDDRVKLNDYNWVLLEENHSSYNLKQTKGKVILINFWATWCPPCIAEMPSLQKLFDKYGEKVEFLFVTNESPEIIKAYKAKNNYTFPVYFRKSEAPEALITTSIPRTVIIDKNGQIVIDKTGAVDWFDTKIQKELNTLLN
ncbi:TlpA disulfide reductase family protein [uncultured Winogradskyella sp.]|uniref:TlpA family protein disulfide reductase n=1 Tax=uncultured Winogradskyella sp. TaxID=395353 RepID=UPI0026376330|nr:TlpA disulfide reductase family protein [uncultured Winogradskyella sp.]